MKKTIIISILLLSTFAFAKKPTIETFIKVDCENRIIKDKVGWEADGEIIRIDHQSNTILDQMSVTVYHHYEVLSGLDILSIKNAACSSKLKTYNAEDKELSDILGTYSTHYDYAIVLTYAPNLGKLLRKDSDIRLLTNPKGFKEFINDMFEGYGPTYKQLEFIYTIE